MTTSADRTPASEINVTPMLDVLLVLLIIFLALSIRMHHTIDAVLPQPCAGACDAGQPIVLEILPGPSYRVNRAVVRREALRSYLAGIYDGRPEKILQVAGFPGVRYQDVVTAMDVARSAGVRVLSVVTERPAR